MRVLLVNPPYGDSVVGFERLMVIEPLALEYVGTILQKEGHQVEILDEVLDNNFVETVKRFRPDVISFTGIYAHIYIINKMCNQAKEIDPDIVTIVAGSHAVACPQEFFFAGVDIVNSGEDLLVVPKLMRGIENKDLSDVEGIHYRTEDGWKKGRTATRCISIDELPFPDRTLTKKYRKNYYWYFEREIAAVWGSVGCPFKCYYCTQWTKNGGRFVARSPESLVAEIKEIKQDAVFIIDDNTFLNEKRVRRIIQLIKENNIHKKYMCYCSANLVIKYRDVLEEWKKYGLAKLMIGFEGVRQKDLNDVSQKTALKTNTEAISILHQLGIDTMAGFIIYPDFTVEDFKSLRRYIRENGIYYAEFTSLTPFPGTGFYEEVKNKVTSYNPELYDMQHQVFDTVLPLKEYYKQVALTYLCTYLPHRAIACKVNFKLSLNPFNPMYRSFVRFVWKNLTAYKDHEKKLREIKTERYTLPHPCEIRKEN